MATMDRNVIVVVDDESNYVDIFRARIRRLAPEYTVLSNNTFGDIAPAAVPAFAKEIGDLVSPERGKVAAIFLDLSLTSRGTENPNPGEEEWRVGLQVGDILRKEFYEIPIVILTTHERAMSEGYYYDFDGFITKPDLSRLSVNDFNGVLLRTTRKREAIVKNLPRYYAQHITYTKVPQSNSVFTPFGIPFVGEANNLEMVLDDAVKIQEYWADLKRYTVVLFADLAGSTEIKEQSGFIEGLRITRIHNQVVTTEVKETGGTVVKYIGDAVMARYDYGSVAEVDEKSVTAAIKIQERLAKFNRSDPKARAILTKIGIAGGKVADFYGNDPQGGPVDLAARIQSLAKPSQILIAQELMSLIGARRIKSEIGIVSGHGAEQYLIGPRAERLKGFAEAIDITEVVWNGLGHGIG